MVSGSVRAYYVRAQVLLLFFLVCLERAYIRGSQCKNRDRVLIKKDVFVLKVSYLATRSLFTYEQIL